LRLKCGERRVPTIRQRKVFVDANTQAKKWVTPAFIVQLTPVSADNTKNIPFSLGFTATKKLGGAVIRNRAKRRMRALVQRKLTVFEGYSGLILIARPPVLTLPFTTLEKDFSWAMKRILGDSQPL
jgi:ribonuclease P protein component